MCKPITHAIRERRKQGSLAVIAELKWRRSEGADLFRGRSAADIARVYQSAGAAALSVVTSALFGGSIRMPGELAAADLGLPILRKDLICTERDIEASKRLDASAILLILPLLGLPRLVALLQAARDQSVEAFVEVAKQTPPAARFT
jgi:indole-3-glycerol phosphate synthase